jgi:hypothetical protein
MRATLKASVFFGFLALVLGLLALPAVAHADAGLVPGSGSAATLKASPAGKALCPFVVRNASGTAQGTVDCTGTFTGAGGASFGSSVFGAGFYGSTLSGPNILTNNVNAYSAGPLAISMQTTATVAAVSVDTAAVTHLSGPLLTVSNNAVQKFAVGFDGRATIANGTASTDAAAWGQVYETVGAHTPVGATGDDFDGFYIAPTGTTTVAKLGYLPVKAGTGAGTYGVILWDLTTSSVVCSVTGLALTSTTANRGTIVGCVGQVLTVGDSYTVNLKVTGGFTTLPSWSAYVQLTH